MRLAPAKGEDLLHQLLCPPARSEDFLQALQRRVARPHVLARKLRIAHDRRQDVVEVMRHATGQRPQRLHLLRLAQLRLEMGARGLDPFDFGNVRDDAEDAGRHAGIVDGARLVQYHVVQRAIGMRNLAFVGLQTGRAMEQLEILVAVDLRKSPGR